MVRGLTPSLSKADQEAVRLLVPWACRPLQKVVTEFAARCQADGMMVPASVSRRAKEIIDMQEQIGQEMLDCIEEQHPDWVNDLAQDVWDKVGGWS
jgi:hypothetical protein